MSHDLLEGLLADVPRQVAPDVGAAWRAGTRRRRRGHLVAVGLAATLVLVGLGVANLDLRRPVAPADGTSGVDSHPSVVERPVPLTELPDRPGPLVGFLDSESDWVVFDERGRSWRLDDVSDIDSYPPALSEDGRMLGYLRHVSDQRSEYLIRDLVTGEATVVQQVGDGVVAHSKGQEFFVSGQGPGLWSPDDRWVALHGGSLEAKGGGPLLVSRIGYAREVAASGWPVGWLAPDRLLLIRGNGVLVTVDLDGTVIERTQLALSVQSRLFGQWAGRLSPDRTRVAVAFHQSGYEGDDVAVFDVATGALLSTPITGRGVAQDCLLAWQGDDVLVWNDTAIAADEADAVVRISNRFEAVGCVTVAADALQGTVASSPGILEWRYWDVWWIWQKILGGLLVIAFVGGIFHLDRRARRRDGEAA